MSKKRILITIISILVVVIIASLVINFILFKYNIITVKDVTLGTDKVIISKLADQQLTKIYPDNLTKEIASCAAGEIKDDGIRVDNVEKATIVESTTKNVTYIACPTRMSNKFGSFITVGTVHNHVDGNCKLSSRDIETYNDDLSRGQQILGVKCNQGYVFYILSKINSEVEKW